jgi:hypothetical protein
MRGASNEGRGPWLVSLLLVLRAKHQYFPRFRANRGRALKRESEPSVPGAKAARAMNQARATGPRRCADAHRVGGSGHDAWRTGRRPSCTA